MNPNAPAGSLAIASAPEADRPTEDPQLRVRGEMVLYRLFDVGYEIDLEQAFHLFASSSPERLRPARGEAQAIRITNPPVTVRLGRTSLAVAGRPLELELSARLFDFGVVSLRARVLGPSPCPWGEFTDWCAAINAAPDWAGHFERWRAALAERVRPAVNRPAVASVAEDYTVFRLSGLEDGAGREVPIRALGEQEVAGLLLGERRALSAATRRDLLSPGFSYYEDDLATIAWNAALVIEPAAEDEDVQYVLEFANAQLLELRYYDALLDGEIPRIYGEIAAARRGLNPFGRRFSRLLGALQTRVADTTEVIERVENSIKVTDDVFLARVYTAALEVFRGRTWRAGIDRKVAILHDAYSMLNAESQAHRAEVLEIAIIALIIGEIVLALLRRG